ncbi:MAG: manganese efflux pump MntP family protein [Coriobacteriales bacterium]
MGVLELLLIGVGLSMDAFAVAVCKGLGMRSINYRHALTIALFFGAFQALMPLLGWALGSQFASFVTPVDHWIAFALLALIGGKMLWDALHEGDAEGTGPHDAVDAAAGTGSCGEAPVSADARDGEGGEGTGPISEGASQGLQAGCSQGEQLDLRELTMLAVATSIDALAVGISFAFLDIDIWMAIALIGVTTFALSFAGVAIGNRFGARYEKGAAIVGGAVLICIGLKILVEHVFG